MLGLLTLKCPSIPDSFSARFSPSPTKTWQGSYHCCTAKPQRDEYPLFSEQYAVFSQHVKREYFFFFEIRAKRGRLENTSTIYNTCARKRMASEKVKISCSGTSTSASSSWYCDATTNSVSTPVLAAVTRPARDASVDRTRGPAIQKYVSALFFQSTRDREEWTRCETVPATLSSAALLFAQPR